MALLAELTGGSLFLVIFVVVTAFVLMLRTQRSLRQSAKSSKQPVTPKMATADKSACRPGAPEMKKQHQVEQWEVRMHDLARELSAQLDSKMSALEHLIQDAERQISRLDARLNEKPENKDNLSELLAAPERSTSLPAPHISTQAAALTSKSTPAHSPRQAGPPPKERRFDDIYALADAGHAPAAIASRVGSPVGEIELILSLRKRS